MNDPKMDQSAIHFRVMLSELATEVTELKVELRKLILNCSRNCPARNLFPGIPIPNPFALLVTREDIQISILPGNAICKTTSAIVHTPLLSRRATAPSSDPVGI